MRFDGWEDMIELASSIHDFEYPMRSTRIPEKMVACMCAATTCEMMEYTFQSHGKTYCRAPESFVPIEEVASRMRRFAARLERTGGGFAISGRPLALPFDDCPRKLRDARPALAPQPSGYREVRLPYTGTRRERRLKRLQDWARRELCSLLEDEGLEGVAHAFLFDDDVPLGFEELQALGEAMWRDYQLLERK